MKRSPSTFTLQEYVGMWNPLTPFFTLDNPAFFGSRQGWIVKSQYVCCDWKWKKTQRSRPGPWEKEKNRGGIWKMRPLFEALSPFTLFIHFFCVKWCSGDRFYRLELILSCLFSIQLSEFIRVSKISIWIQIESKLKIFLQLRCKRSSKVLCLEKRTQGFTAFGVKLSAPSLGLAWVAFGEN